VPASWLGNETSLCLNNLSPGLGGTVVVPEIAQLIVLIVLASVDEEVVVVESTRLGGAGLWALDTELTASDVLALNAGLRRFESKKLIASEAVNKSAENHETAVAAVTQHMVVSRRHFSGRALKGLV